MSGLKSSSYSGMNSALLYLDDATFAIVFHVKPDFPNNIPHTPSVFAVSSLVVFEYSP